MDALLGCLKPYKIVGAKSDTMTTAFNTEERRFLQMLDHNPEFREEVRRRLLSEELLNLPARFAAFIETVNSFIAQQQAANARYDQFITEQRQFNLDQRRFNARTDSRLESLERGQAIIISRIDEMRGDISDVKGDRTIQAAIRKGPQICRQINLRFVRRLDQADLVNLAAEQDASDISEQDLESYENADLVMEATDPDGNLRLVAVEASHTANRNDAGRARRNARYLTRFTGIPAVAIIASADNDPEAGQQVADGLLHWHRLQERDLHPR